MKLDFAYQKDGYHQYCIHCHAESIERTYRGGNTYYHCLSCGKEAERSIVIDPAIKWWVEQDGEYCHESAAVFVLDDQDKLLVFNRTIFPLAFTVPSGHVDTGEQPIRSAQRELLEEAGIEVKTSDLKLVSRDMIAGDSCRRGADVHRWHAYVYRVGKRPKIIIREEGINPTWLSLKELAKKEDVIYPVKYVIGKYAHELIS